MQPEKLRELLRKYAAGECTVQEQKWLEDKMLRKPIAGAWDWSSEEEKIQMGLRIKKNIDRQRLAKRDKIIRRLWIKGVAASFLLLLGYLWIAQYQQKKEEKIDRLVINESVSHAVDGIVLTLADGTKINLDQQEGALIEEQGVSIRKTRDGLLVYESDGDASPMAAEAVAQNTISTPNGKQFQLSLPDGTQVWLNTASKLSYPLVFTGGERRVSLEGEAYFEVAPNSARPFKITALETEIEVTGTHFNVSAYTSDKKVITTLLEGGVRVYKDEKQVALGPGYQATTYQGKQGIEKRVGNIEQTMAWKNGYFIFDNMDIVSIMKNVARWYDIQIVVEGKMPFKQFGGTFPMTGGLDELLNDLSTIGQVQFEKKGKEVRIIW
ncbi:FecR family protein [Olivibacter sp. XZL3]|uniref:FecR family protein n=1 Tax=Olivibacter sp. XZL3 TaxID=1735116 RepID=UPI0010661220|nr:FecR domain-containing protein [Olivibacter sp. XZL3]